MLGPASECLHNRPLRNAREDPRENVLVSPSLGHVLPPGKKVRPQIPMAELPEQASNAMQIALAHLNVAPPRMECRCDVPVLHAQDHALHQLPMLLLDLPQREPCREGSRQNPRDHPERAFPQDPVLMPGF
jgi:hypothetical protein